MLSSFQAIIGMNLARTALRFNFFRGAMTSIPRFATLRPQRGPVPRRDGLRDSGWGVVVRWCGVSLVAAVAALCTAWPPYANAPPIRSDGLGYHAWTRAILTWDFTFCRY